jgi:hypothetical protein
MGIHPHLFPYVCNYSMGQCSLHHPSSTPPYSILKEKAAYLLP